MIRPLLLTLSLLIATLSVASAWCCPMLEALATSAAAQSHSAAAGCPHHAPDATDPALEERSFAGQACCCPAPLAPQVTATLASLPPHIQLSNGRDFSLPSPPRAPPLRPPAALA